MSAIRTQNFISSFEEEASNLLSKLENSPDAADRQTSGINACFSISDLCIGAEFRTKDCSEQQRIAISNLFNDLADELNFLLYKPENDSYRRILKGYPDKCREAAVYVLTK